LRREPSQARTIAVALHGIEPATFERCALIRDWLDDHGVDRVTLLVIPARDLHPVGERSPEMVRWLDERSRAGDSIAQHGFQHVRLGDAWGSPVGAGQLLSFAHGRRNGEFVGLDPAETRRAVDAGWRVLKLAGLEPDGFVAPSYAYTTALRETLSRRFRWWAGLLRVHRGAGGVEDEEPHPTALAPALRLTAGGPFARAFSPSLLRLGAVLPTRTLRLDVHPGDLQNSGHMLALEWVLARNGSSRTAVTYRELAGV
jgi:predicted deacetylase